jgi:hypothetical protein
MRLPCGLLLALLPLAPLLAADAERLPAVSYDTRNISGEQLALLKAKVDAGFWLETGDALLVAAPEPVHAALSRQARVAAQHGLLGLDELVTLPVGCDVDVHAVPTPLAVMGRQALVRMPREIAAQHPEARAVAANSVLASEYRNAGRARGALDPQILALLQRVDTARWFGRVETLASFDRSSYGAAVAGSEMNQARDWLALTFESLGLATTTPTFSGGSVMAENVIAVRPGTTRPDEWVLIGGHYDSRNTVNGPSGIADTPGAEDNASGCAGVLEMASLFADLPTERTLLFACYAGEEQGLFGSLAHAQALADSGDLPRIKLALIMDMIGYSQDSDFDILLESGATSTQTAVLGTFAQLAADYVPGSRTIIDTSPCCSDHMPWINRGVPALLTIENDWFQYPHYHRSTDLPQNMTNAQPMADKILRTNAAAVATWAVLDDSRVFIDGFE